MFPDEAPLTQGCASAWYSITSPETLRSGLDKALSQDKRCSVMTSWRAVLDSGLFFKGRWCFCMTWAHKVLETLKLYAPEWDWECCWCLGSFCCGKLWLETPNIAFICHTIQPYSFKKNPNNNKCFISSEFPELESSLCLFLPLYLSIHVMHSSSTVRSNLSWAPCFAFIHYSLYCVSRCLVRGPQMSILGQVGRWPLSL